MGYYFDDPDYIVMAARKTPAQRRGAVIGLALLILVVVGAALLAMKSC